MNPIFLILRGLRIAAAGFSRENGGLEGNTMKFDDPIVKDVFDGNGLGIF